MKVEKCNKKRVFQLENTFFEDLNVASSLNTLEHLQVWETTSESLHRKEE